MTHTDNAPPLAHTPGPWHITGESHRDYEGAEIGTGDKTVAVIVLAAAAEATDEDRGNSYLITAAPELLEALDYLLEQTVDMDLKYGICLSEGEEEARAQALAAIAKAKGGA